MIIDPRHAWINNAQPQISSCSDSKSSRGSGCRSVVTVVSVLGMGGTQGRGNLSHLRKSVKVFMGIQSESHLKGGGGFWQGTVAGTRLSRPECCLRELVHFPVGIWSTGDFRQD